MVQTVHRIKEILEGLSKITSLVVYSYLVTIECSKPLDHVRLKSVSHELAGDRSYFRTRLIFRTFQKCEHWLHQSIRAKGD